jgi:hypothetical protein
VLALTPVWVPQGADRIAAAQGQELVHGVIIDSTNPNSMRLAREAGFTHAKMILYWPRLQPTPGPPMWHETSENDLDNVMRAAAAEDIFLILRIDEVPAWAGGLASVADLVAVESFYRDMASKAQGRVAGYEILNEPNLPIEWGGPPDAASYTEFLKAAWRGIKAGDPAALVIGGGPSPNTGGFGGTIEDMDFLAGMYRAGARGYFDAMGIHNYGGSTPPERDPGDCGGICFRRAELYREVMVRHGDGSTPIWATEFGWLMDPGRWLGQYDWMKVSPEHQADYVVRSYRYAAENWPWMQGMLLSNLDASTSGYHPGPEDGLPWFSILNEDYSPRPAYEAFKEMRAVAGRARRTGPRVAAAASTESAQVRVSGTGGQGVNLRAEPGTAAPVVAVLQEGATLTVIGPDREASGRTWRNVQQPNGPAGWVAGEFVK